MAKKNQIIIYEGDKGRLKIEVHFEGELDEKVVRREFRRTTEHGAIKGKTQRR